MKLSRLIQIINLIGSFWPTLLCQRKPSNQKQLNFQFKEHSFDIFLLTWTQSNNPVAIKPIKKDPFGSLSQQMLIRQTLERRDCNPRPYFPKVTRHRWNSIQGQVFWKSPRRRGLDLWLDQLAGFVYRFLGFDRFHLVLNRVGRRGVAQLVRASLWG